ncbi:unnamed protein product [Zymoseptoria tritici ST99CH_3D7]|uniref:Major facilitator superfamily (MFS) profile domain-containing protein n=1 Tax=Zymoseptoria tritici (strain ST99CH_3D7) TaxID=1276538 RepID=A0A1X7RR57_ZYMT9|nr:unnamed protein product [Zymoseptoria tritici ST99CH_3D7]
MPFTVSRFFAAASLIRARPRALRKMDKLERKFVFKLDLFIMVYCCLCYFFNYLDRAAFPNAYVSGMKEDLNLEKNQYSILLSMFTAGSVVAQIPHSLIIQKVPMRIWLPLNLVLWSGITMCSAACKTYSQLCAVRFLQGASEAVVYSGSMYVMGSWYKPSEIAKRAAIFTAVGQIGSMFAGIMMTAMNKSLHSNAGLKGWQWVFIINGLMAMPVAVFGFLFFPDLPETTTVTYFSDDEIKFAIGRLPPKKKDTHKIEWRSLLGRVLKQPHIYLLVGLSIFASMLEAFAFQGLYLLWLKYNKSRFNQTAINSYPLGIQGVAIVSQILAGWFIDSTNKRIPIVILSAALQFVVAVILLQRNMSDAGVMTAFYLSGTSYMVNPTMYGWASTICQRAGDDAVRSVILYAMSMGGLLLYTFWGIIMYPATDVPYWQKGSIAMIVACAFFVASGFSVQWLDTKTKVAAAISLDEESDEYNQAQEVTEKAKVG